MLQVKYKIVNPDNYENMQSVVNNHQSNLWLREMKSKLAAMHCEQHLNKLTEVMITYSKATNGAGIAVAKLEKVCCDKFAENIKSLIESASKY